MAGLSPFTVMTNIFVTEFSEFSETFRKNSIASVRNRLKLLNLLQDDNAIPKEAINTQTPLALWTDTVIFDFRKLGKHKGKHLDHH